MPGPAGAIRIVFVSFFFIICDIQYSVFKYIYILANFF